MSGVGIRTMDFGAAGILAGAGVYSTMALTGSPTGAAVAGVAAFLAARTGLCRIDDRPTLRLPQFALAEIETAAPDDLPELLLTDLTELLLTDVAPHSELLLTDVAPQSHDGELLLDDPLDAAPADSRVIRLFDPRTLPTAGEMHERIERHLQEPSADAFPDASAELHQALAELRKSLR